jgi:transcriptional regulator GlxA family with amidase domain
VDIIEAGRDLPLTTLTLAKQCHVSVRSLQEGFRRHLGTSPMAYLRVVRLQRAPPGPAVGRCRSQHRRLIAHRWGFIDLGRFAAAHNRMYGETPLQALRATR